MLLNENKRISDLLMYETGEEFNYDRDAIILASGGVPVIIGQLLGKVTATGKYVEVAPAASDGSQVAAALALGAGDPTSADVTIVALTRGPAIVKASAIAYTAGMNNTQKATALAQLLAIGIKVEQDYGV